MAMDINAVPQSPFTTILNFRDVGFTVNSLLGKQLMKDGQLLRSARPDAASRTDREALTFTYHIKSIIDLRSKSEHLAQSHVRNPGTSHDTSHDTLQAVTAASTDPFPPLPNVTYNLISLTGSAFERSLFLRLRWSSMAKLLYYLAMGHRTQGIFIIGSEVMAPRGLIGLAIDTLKSSATELAAIFTLIANPASFPFMAHCTQGKDRTGLVVILALLLCDVPLDAIVADYRASERELLPEREDRMREIRAIGLGEEFAGCEDGFVEGVVEWLEQECQGVDTYMERIGVNSELRKSIRTNLLI